ncbi:MAG: VapC toxin family PIN domain ribonuclease [Chloroflexi bacterium]|nr:type II toxin-antitoxin system VapC family toxin [Chloroflexi bacterium CFX1]MCK6566138.1 PIN domain-containing protein [Anaerolineales bacterium]MCQ3952737.1 VapC toxin family PIN domain ribonuclease [Chloroflexota bacterium]MDL1920233.1 type II toxin-antitoxin system VapC family toxin [Chloroflexi bacterium CFX5]NUQ58917.1 PIN domain-containing protein [Anaerolineales bacterium]
MSSEKYLLDTSALLALIEAESGADRVREIFTRKQVILPWTVLMEVYYISFQERGQQEAETRFAMLRHSSAEVIWEMSEAITLMAAKIKAENRISFADAVISALAIQHNAVLVHKDPEYEQLVGQVEMEALPFKT